ncbi:MAG: arsenate reductase family protein [Anaerotruncus sp.]|nr:arsenate reductase family protein [Anaerotruncus sp.]
MECLFLEYPKCSTCQKARKWLIENGVTHISRHIVEQNPDIEELKRWCLRSGQPLKKFFNTSGMVYKQLNLKEKLPNMSEEEQYELLASNGMLVKRPLVITETTVLIGFKPAEWEILKGGSAK